MGNVMPELSPRALRILRLVADGGGWRTRAVMRDVDPQRLMRIADCGRRTYREIQEWLQAWDWPPFTKASRY